jgi:hypothetical protein
MKNRFLIIAIVICIFLFAACTGDHSTHGVKDTGENRFGVDTAKIDKTNIDTSKVTSKTGDASTIDNSGSGGTKTAKDTGNHKNRPKK